jgi:type I restriction enzyme, S subunit
MKKGWEIKKLKEVCDKITDGTHQTPKYFDDGFIFLSSRNVTSGVINWDNIKYIDEKQHLEMQKRVSPRVNDVLLAKNGTTGVAAIVDRDVDFDIYVSLALLRPLKNLLPTYLLYFINSPLAKEQFDGRLKGVGVPNLHLNEIREVEIPLPSLPEQRRIVSLLDEAFAALDQAVANVQRNLENAKALFQSELNRVFTEGGHWEQKKLKDIALTFGRGKSKHRPRNDSKLYGGNYPFIQTGDVRNADKYITEYSQTYNEIGLAQSKLWKKGTICITIAANIAETGILEFDSCFPDSMIGLVVDPKKADVNFAYYALLFLKAKLQLLGKGSAQDNINMGTFDEQKFPFPSLKEQTDIVSSLDALSLETGRLEAFYGTKLRVLGELKKSLLSKAFSGGL